MGILIVKSGATRALALLCIAAGLLGCVGNQPQVVTIEGLATYKSSAYRGTVGVTLLTLPSSDAIYAADTSSTGAFMLPGVPANDYLLTVKLPGSLGSLYSVYRKADAAYAPINIFTTIVAQYLQRYPDQTAVQASSKVKRFLAVPQDLNVVDGFGNNSKIFSDYVFVSRVPQGSTINAYIDSLLPRIDGGVDTISFGQKGLLLSATDDSSVFDTVYDWAEGEVVGFAKGLLKDGAKAAFGAALQALGWGPGPSTDQQILDQVKQINALLRAQSVKLNQIQVSLSETEQKVLDGIFNQQTATAYKSFSQILSIIDSYKKISAYDQAVFSDPIKGSIASGNVNKFFNDLCLMTSATNNVMLDYVNGLRGALGAPGMIRSLSASIAGGSRFYGYQQNKKFWDTVDKYMFYLNIFYILADSYFEKGVVIQPASDAASCDPKSGSVVRGLDVDSRQQFAQNYQSYVNDIQALLPAPLPEAVTIDRQDKLMYYSYSLRALYGRVSLDENSNCMVGYVMDAGAWRNPTVDGVLIRSQQELDYLKNICVQNVDKLFPKAMLPSVPDYISMGWRYASYANMLSLITLSDGTLAPSPLQYLADKGWNPEIQKLDLSIPFYGRPDTGQTNYAAGALAPKVKLAQDCGMNPYISVTSFADMDHLCVGLGYIADSPQINVLPVRSMMPPELSGPGRYYYE